MYKGHDRANVTLQDEETNEISEYLDGRYFTHNEAHWNITKLPQHGKQNADDKIVVHRLPYHLENQQIVRFTTRDTTLKQTVNELKFVKWFTINATEKALVEKLTTLEAATVRNEEEISRVKDQLPKKRTADEKYAFEILYQVIFLFFIISCFLKTNLQK